MAQILYKDIIKNKEINEFIKKGDANLATLGYTEHSKTHCMLVSERAAYLLEKFGHADAEIELKRFGYCEHDIELAKIAGYMHDIGNAVNREHHAEYGALLANDILRRMDMPFTDRATIVSAIGHHDESTGGAVDIVSAAMIIADKTDVRRSRVRSRDKSTYDIHDWVNYAVTEANLKINREKRQIALELKIDEKICTMYEYFDIFLGRMQMCRHGAELFGTKFKLTANGSKVL